MNSADLVSYVRQLGSIPDGRFSDGEILGFANQETLTIVKDIISANQDYLVEVSSSVIAASIRVPTRALGGKVRDIVVQMIAGGVTSPGQYVNVPRVDLSDRFANPIGYYYNGNQIMMWNVVNAIGSTGAYILCSYYARPGQLIPTGSAFQVTEINGTALTGTGADPRTFVQTDYIKGNPGFETAYIAQNQSQLSGTSATTVVVNPTATPNFSGTQLEVGDWLSAANTSPVVQLPLEFHQVLAQRVIVKCLESIGDQEGFQRAQSKAQEMQDAALSLITERDDGHPEKFRLDVYSPWVYANRWRWWR